MTPYNLGPFCPYRLDATYFQAIGCEVLNTAKQAMFGTILVSMARHLTPLSRLSHPINASPLDAKLSMSMSFGDPTYTFSMSSYMPTNFRSSSTHVDHCQHSFHIHCRTSLHWSSLIATPSMIFAT
jgi:hypothetical protein